MDGFYIINSKTAMGYYKSPGLPYYYSLFPQFTLCANYFCGNFRCPANYSILALFKKWATGGP